MITANALAKLDVFKSHSVDHLHLLVVSKIREQSAARFSATFYFDDGEEQSTVLFGHIGPVDKQTDGVMMLKEISEILVREYGFAERDPFASDPFQIHRSDDVRIWERPERF